MKKHTISIVGGDNFLGRYIASQLVKCGHMIRIGSLDESTFIAQKIKISASVGQISNTHINLKNPKHLQSFATKTDILIDVSCFSGKKTEAQEHEKSLAKICNAEEVKKLIYLQNLPVSSDSGAKHTTKPLFENTTLMNVDVPFGENDHLINFMLKIASISPFLLSYNKTFCPIYAGDIAHAICKICNAEIDWTGDIVLKGAKKYQYNEIIMLLKKYYHTKHAVIHIPNIAFTMIASLLKKIGINESSHQGQGQCELQSNLKDFGIKGKDIELFIKNMYSGKI